VPHGRDVDAPVIVIDLVNHPVIAHTNAPEVRAEFAKLTAYSATAPSPGRRLNQSLHRGEGFTRLGPTLLGNVGVVQVFPQGTVLLEVNQHGLTPPA
jgi:hypothetical protein